MTEENLKQSSPEINVHGRLHKTPNVNYLKMLWFVLFVSQSWFQRFPLKAVLIEGYSGLDAQ